jgi:hypothetical protein
VYALGHYSALRALHQTSEVVSGAVESEQFIFCELEIFEIP